MIDYEKLGKILLPKIIGEKVHVHWHFRKKLYSVQKKQKVVGHFLNFSLKDAYFNVREGGRWKAVETRQRNVHAFVVGTFSDEVIENPAEKGYRLVSYNPFWSEFFYYKDNEDRIDSIREKFHVVFNSEGMWVSPISE